MSDSSNSAAGSQDVNLIAINVSTSEQKDLPSFKFFLIKKMDWLPDRTGLIISARKSAGFDNQLFRVSYPAMEVTQITEGLTASGTTDIWIMQRDGKEQKQLTVNAKASR